MYGYDEENRLVYASTDVGNMQYTITAEGLRSGKSGSVSGASYVTDIDGKVIKENEAEIIVGHQALAKKIGDAYYYYIYNAHGDVIMMVDESGNIVNQYEYDAWGKITEETETVPNSIKYAGEYYDEETGFIYLRNRMYDPETRRFTSEDPARDQLNWYSYCGNNPVIFVDPWGLDAIIITDIDGAYAQGHISGIFQDSVGNWYYFYWGNKEAFVQQVTDNSAMNSLDSFNKWLNENNIYSGKYDYATYIAGDFTESFLHAVEISKNYSTDQYNLLFRNCMQVTWECILKGKFKDGTPIGNMVTLNIGIRPNSNYRFIGYAFYNFDFTYAGYWKTINDALWSARQRLATESTNWGRNVVQKRIDLLEKLYS